MGDERGRRDVDMEYPVRDRAGYDGEPALPQPPHSLQNITGTVFLTS